MPSSAPSRRVRFGPFEADLRSGELRRDGVKVRLQEQPFQVLALLLERPGEVVTRDELQSRLWPADTFVDFEHGLNTAIKKLRQALEDSAEAPRFVETLARRGYRLIAPVTVEPPGRRIAERSRVGRAADRQRSGRRWLFAGVAGLLVLGLGYFLNARRSPAPEPSRSPMVLAILPFHVAAESEQAADLGVGLADDVTTHLANFEAIRVRPTRAVLRYQGASVDVRRAGPGARRGQCLERHGPAGGRSVPRERAARPCPRRGLLLGREPRRGRRGAARSRRPDHEEGRLGPGHPAGREGPDLSTLHGERGGVRGLSARAGPPGADHRRGHDLVGAGFRGSAAPRPELRTRLRGALHGGRRHAPPFRASAGGPGLGKAGRGGGRARPRAGPQPRGGSPGPGRGPRQDRFRMGQGRRGEPAGAGTESEARAPLLVPGAGVLPPRPARGRGEGGPRGAGARSREPHRAHARPRHHAPASPGGSRSRYRSSKRSNG